MTPPRLLLVLSLLLVVPLAAACRTAAAPLRAVRGGDGLAAAIRDARVVHVGESHDDFAHHVYQRTLLEMVIAEAEREGVPALLGMEMFQRPFQRHLDDYVAGRIDEREMLRRTEWYDRWQYDHTLYAPLWQLCRERGVRVVALNAEASVVRAVGRGGLESLDARQRGQIADEIDLTVASHRARIMAAFQDGAHPMPEEALQGMYEAMTTWDETMAETAAEALTAAGPGSRMLVVAGSQHVQEFTGIPDRVARRLPGVEQLVVVLRTEGAEETEPAEGESATPVEPQEDLGDFVAWLEPRDAPPRRLLGVQLQTEPLPEGLLVSRVLQGGNAERAGLLADDVLQWVGGARVTDMVDLRYRLAGTALGETVVVRVLRDGRPHSVELTFAPPAPHPQG